MAYDLSAPVGLTASILPGAANVRVQWSAYAPADAAGHQIIGYRLFRNSVPSPRGTLIANEAILGPLSTQYDDVGEPVQGQIAYYTLIAIEPDDFGARPFGEGGNVPFGA